MNEGYVIDQDGIGLRLTAMEYWKCSELGVSLPFKNKRDPDCKFVVAESLPDQGDPAQGCCRTTIMDSVLFPIPSIKPHMV